jgi:hypothetical protein
MNFSHKETVLLGDKSSLEQQIHKITGINLSALRGTPFVSVQRRGQVVMGAIGILVRK